MTEYPRYRRTAQTLSSEIGEDVVALQLDRGYCYGMEQVSAAVWRLLAEPSDVPTLCDRLADEFEVEPERCRRDVVQLLEQMRGEGLVEQA